MALDIARWLANKATNDATTISGTALHLFNQLGQDAFKAAIMKYVREIQEGLSAHYPGCNFICEGVHPVKRKLIKAFYTRLVRERVMPEIYKLVEELVKPGAFAAVTMIAEDLPRITRQVTFDKSAATEERLKEITKNVKWTAGATDRIIGAIDNDDFDALDFSSESSSSSSSEEEDDEPQLPRPRRQAIRAAPEPARGRSRSPPPEPRKRPVRARGRVLRATRVLTYEESSESESIFDDEADNQDDEEGDLNGFVVPDEAEQPDDDEVEEKPSKLKKRKV